MLRFIPSFFNVMVLWAFTASMPTFAEQPNVAERLTTEVLSKQGS